MTTHIPAVAEIDLDAIRHNVRRMLEVSGVEVMAVVKADAYGHGAAPLAVAVRSAGATWLGVAFCSEALALRAAGDTGRMLAWIHGPGNDSLVECLAAYVDVSVSSVEQVEYVAAAARRAGVRARVHAKVDTGLGRAGALPAAWPDLLRAAAASRDIEVVGLWSHLACSDDPSHAATAQQTDAFCDALDTAGGLGVSGLRHLANSGAAFSAPQTRFDLVRCGIAVYGLSPGPALGSPADLGLRPAMTVRTSVVQVKEVPAGHGASYGLTWRAPRATSLALIPIGYADGIPRTAVGAQVSIGGVRFPIVGRIAMDQVIVDVGTAQVVPGDEVVVLGPGIAGEPTASTWAGWSDTIDYEIVTRIGARVTRKFIG